MPISEPDTWATALADGAYGPFEGDPDDDVVFGHYRRTGAWAPELLSLMRARLAGGGTLLDVGANIGLTTIPLLSCTPATAHCFEPAPNNLMLLGRNLTRHGLERRARVHPVALHARAGTAALALADGNSGDHHLDAAPPGHGARPRVEVATARLDDLVAGRSLSPPVLMKVDTQGAEVCVLQGAPRTLPHVDHLVIEYWPLGLSRLGHRPADLARELRAFPFAALLGQQGQQLRMEPTEQLLQRLAFFSDVDPGFFDLLLSRRR